MVTKKHKKNQDSRTPPPLFKEMFLNFTIFLVASQSRETWTKLTLKYIANIAWAHMKRLTGTTEIQKLMPTQGVYTFLQGRLVLVWFYQGYYKLRQSMWLRWSQKNLGSRVALLPGKFFANLKNYCDKFIIGWRISGYFGKCPDAIQSTQMICKVSGWTGKCLDDLKSVWMI